MLVPLTLTTQPVLTLLADVLLGVLFGVLVQGAWSWLLMNPDTPFLRRMRSSWMVGIPWMVFLFVVLLVLEIVASQHVSR